jgi:hypothetical protein
VCLVSVNQYTVVPGTEFCNFGELRVYIVF